MVIVNRNTRGMDFSDNGAPDQFTQVFGLTTTPRVKNNYDLYSLTTAYDLSADARISNTISYIRAVAPQWNVPAYFQSQPVATADTTADYLVPLQDISDRLLTDELRLTSAGNGPWQWTVGGFFRRYTDAINAPVNYYGVPGPASDPLPEPYGSDIESSFKSWSAFVDTSYRLWDRLTVGAGVRGFRETQHFTDFLALTEQSGTFHSVDPRVYLQ
jgi:hypothetical protein